MFEIKMHHIQTIVKDAGFGGTSPIIVKANNKEYILKTKEDGTLQKSLGIFNELLSYQLISYLNLNIAPQEIVYLLIDDNFIEMAQIAYNENIIKQESLENIKNSKGVNLGIEYINNAMDPLNKTVANKTFIKKLAYIDNYIMNCDRTKDNMNILQDKSNLKKYYAIDFGNALVDGVLYEKILEDGKECIDILTQGIFTNCNVTLSKRYFLKENIKKLVKKGYKNKEDIDTIRNILKEIINKFPPEWEPLEYKDCIIEIIALRMKNNKIFLANESNICPCLY